MTSLLLVHGAWMGSWAWDRVVPSLRDCGYTVATPDLLGYAAGDPPAGEVTRRAAIERLAGELGELPTPVTVVGHSMGGTVISELAEAAPDAISRLIYLAAYLIADGQSAMEVTQSMPQFWTSALGGEGVIVPQPDHGGTVIATDAIADAFAADADPDTQHWAAQRMRLDPFAYGGTALHLTSQRWGSIDRAYIETVDDRAIPLAAQQAMHKAIGVTHVRQLGSSHTPMLSQPEQLAAVIDELTRA